MPAKLERVREKSIKEALKQRAAGKNTLTDEEISAMAEAMVEDARLKERAKIDKRRAELGGAAMTVKKYLNMFRQGQMYSVPTDMTTDEQLLICLVQTSAHS